MERQLEQSLMLYMTCFYSVKTVRNKTICLNATWKWAQTLLQDFNKAIANKKLPSPPLGSPNRMMEKTG